MCDVVCVVCQCVFAVCVGERAEQVGSPSVDCEPAQEEAALSRLRYVTDLSSHTSPHIPALLPECVGRCVCFQGAKLGCWEGGTRVKPTKEDDTRASVFFHPITHHIVFVYPKSTFLERETLFDVC